MLWLQVQLVTGETTRQLINENSVCVNLVKRMCKDLNINNPTEWGIYEIWDYAGTIAVTTTVYSHHRVTTLSLPRGAHRPARDAGYD